MNEPTYWTDSDRIAVFNAITADEAKGWAANLHVLCPIRETPSLAYERKDFFHMQAKCLHCKQWIQQG